MVNKNFHKIPVFSCKNYVLFRMFFSVEYVPNRPSPRRALGAITSHIVRIWPEPSDLTTVLRYVIRCGGWTQQSRHAFLHVSPARSGHRNTIDERGGQVHCQAARLGANQRYRDFRINSEVRCQGPHPLCGAFSRRNLKTIKLGYNQRRPDADGRPKVTSAFNWLGQYASRAYFYAELAVSSLAATETIVSTHCAYPCRDGQAE